MLALVKSTGNLAAVAYGPLCSVVIRMWERQAATPSKPRLFHIAPASPAAIPSDLSG